MASCLKLPMPTAFRSPCCSRHSSSPRAGSAPGTRPSPLCGTSSWASSPSRTSSPSTTTSDGPTPSQGASSVTVLGRPTIFLIGTPMVFDEMLTQQEASKGGVLPITSMLQVPTISSMVMSNKNASPAFFVLEPVQPSTSLFNAIKVTMPLCTWVFSGTYGMQMLVSFGDHVVFDRGKHIESLLWPFHPISSTLSAVVPVRLLCSSPQTRMVFLQDADVTVQIPDVFTVQEQFCWYSNIPCMSLHGAVGCFLVITSKHFQSLSPPVSSIFTSAVYPSVLFWGVTVLPRQLLRSIHFHSLSEDDQIVVVLFVYKDVLFPCVSGNCPVAGYALWDPGGVVLQLVWFHMLEISCHFILVLLVEFWKPMWLPIFTFKVQCLLLDQIFVLFKLPDMLNLQTGLEKMHWTHPQILLQEVSVATSLGTQPYHIVGVGDVSAAMKVKLFWSSPHLRMMLLDDFHWLIVRLWSICIFYNIILRVVLGDFSYQFITCWAYKRDGHVLLWFWLPKRGESAAVMLQVAGFSSLAGSKMCNVPVQSVVLMLHDMDTFRQEKLLATSDIVLDKHKRYYSTTIMEGRYLHAHGNAKLVCSHPTGSYQLQQSKWIPIQFSSTTMSQTTWDPGGFQSGLRASRILSGGECHIPAKVGRDTWACVCPRPSYREEPYYKGSEAPTSGASKNREPEPDGFVVFLLPSETWSSCCSCYLPLILAIPAQIPSDSCLFVS